MMDIMIVTGMSGAGKTFAGSVLEDFGYYCIDNIPVSLLSQFIDLYSHQEGKNQKIALIIDVRGCDNFNELISILNGIREKSYGHCHLLFLDASPEVLINRYKETRRTHPLMLSHPMTLSEALQKEQLMLSEVKRLADDVIDTTHLSQNACREQLNRIVHGNTAPQLVVQCFSFGFKYGLPHEADLIFDVRCLPNPFYIDELKHKTGLDKDVSDYVMSFETSQTFFKKICDLVEYLLPLYLQDGRSQLNVAFGCTGGKHRSVTMAEALCKHLGGCENCTAMTMHRDIAK